MCLHSIYSSYIRYIYIYILLIIWIICVSILKPETCAICMVPWPSGLQFTDTNPTNKLEVSKDIIVPRKSALYTWRINIDLASILFARRHWFSSSTSWYIHCRLDSSPQFGRDYLMSEVDVWYPEGFESWKNIADGLHTRLLVGQTIGARASGVVIKTHKLLHQLELDACQVVQTCLWVWHFLEGNVMQVHRLSSATLLSL